ncbi:penicillin-binding protein 1A [Piscinibacter sp.]|uniref:penicillin-binding protein 1A n=1 Tax=Piscinibacter sp. TaxID=1903157 RepID=UPI0035599826
MTPSPMPPWRQRLRRAAPALCGLAAGAALSLIALVALLVAVATPNLPDIGSLTDYRPQQPMRVLSADGVLLGEFGEERRHFTPIAQIPKILQDAVLAVEDADFYRHSGVNYKGVLRAALANFGRQRSQGASTITMQVARNFYLPTEKTYIRKFYEMLLALKIESQLSKEQILEIYMNQIYLGQRAYGFASASEIYFGKSLGELSVAEAAMLAGLPQSPIAGNPIANPRRASARQAHVLRRMLAGGVISAAQYDQARQQSVSLRTPSEVPMHAEYVAEVARQLVVSQYGNDAYRRGLNVVLTINAADQAVAYRALRKGIMDFERRQAYRGPEELVDLPADVDDLDARIAEALADHPDNDELKAAVVLEVAPTKVVAALQSGELVTISGDGLKPAASGLSARASPKTRIRRGAVIRLAQGETGAWIITQLPQVEAAFVAMDPHSGALRAMVGGFDYSKSQFNHVTQAWRQPGSSLKPFIYSAALEKGFTPATVINDAPLSFDAAANGGEAWQPKNSDGNFDGPMALRSGLAKSKNLVSIRILQAIGVPYAQDWLARFGFDAERQPATLAMALGAGAVTPLQMASAYSVFANGGYRLNPVLISRLTDSSGRVLSESAPQLLDESLRVVDARNTFTMSSLLQDVTRPGGTAARAQATLQRSDIYGKTGTTNDAMDAWFAGYQPSVVAVVWMGYDQPRSLGDRESGGGLALPIWLDYMAHALKGVPVDEPAAPDGVVNLNGEWYYKEFAPGSGVGQLGIDDPQSPRPTEDERRSILDLFK